MAHLLEGSVQRVSNRVRVNAQLIDARNDAHCGHKLTIAIGRCFAIQTEIAKAIADQLRAKLSPAEKSAIEQRPTNDVAAFDLYSPRQKPNVNQGLHARSQPKAQRSRQILLNQALQRDPSFFVASASSSAHTTSSTHGSRSHSGKAGAQAGDAVEAAIRLRPEAASLTWCGPSICTMAIVTTTALEEN